MPRDAFRIAFSANMSAEKSDEGEIMLYGQIVQDLGKYYKEFFPNDKCASDFDAAIKSLKKQGARKLTLRINSPGGIVTEAVAMRGALTGAGFDEITIRIEGMCASAATLIASIPDAHVIITPGSEYMIHNPWMGAWGNANDLEKAAEHLRQLEKTSRSFYEQKSGQAEDQIKRWMDEETWFSAEDAVKYGFADAVAYENGPAVACVSSREMDLMHGLYKAVPQQIAVKEAQDHDVSNAAPVAGDATEIKNEEVNPMEIKDLTQEQLLAENPALLEQIQQAAIQRDQQRREDIDAITPPVQEYQQMAEEAKKNGTSAMDFHKQLVAAMKQKGAAHQEARIKETAPAKEVIGGAEEDNNKHNDDHEIQQHAKILADYAKQYRGGADGDMF